MSKRELFKRITIFAVILALLCGGWLVYSNYKKPISRTFFAADTVCTITLYDGDETVLDGAVNLCNDLAERFNCKDDNSEVGLLNKTKFCENPSDDLLDILVSGLYYSALEESPFDITVKPLSDLWDFKNEYIPRQDELDLALSKIGYRNISIRNNQITLKNNAEIDLGGIAKGYIADRISDFLVKNGVKSGIINLGGNVTLIGNNKNKDFSVGIQKPFSDELAATVRLSDCSVVTSGIYQRYFEKDGVKYHHLLNIKNGYPEQNGLASVTVISHNATNADALSTLIFLMGLEKGLNFVNDREGLECVFIKTTGEIILSNGLKTENQKVITLK